MGDGKNRDPRPALAGVKHLLDAQRLAADPAAEGRAGDQGVKLHGQVHALGLGVEGFQRQDPDLFEGRLHHLADQGFQGERLAQFPGGEQDRTEQDVLAALEGVSRDTEQAEQ